MIENKLIEVLRIIVERLEQQKFKWVLVGSASLALQNVKIKPGDVDILTDGDDALKMNEIFKDFKVRDVEFKTSEIFESYFGEFNINGVKVEIMGDLKEKIDGEWTSLKDRLKRTEYVEVDSFKVPVSPLSEQLVSYEKLGREKDKVKVELIREALNNKS
ncbi:hypothetical protein KO361_04645 [Candidatus Woesearchaeota archaeon]|nr:hypothetical protein [Candidatus Woesearchaeota archaeon]